jgi:hypothetical protein
MAGKSIPLAHSTFPPKMRSKRNKPRWILNGDRSHPNLKLVDEFRREMTYDGNKRDINEMEKAHLEGDTFTFEQAVFKIKECENMYYGDRSHPRLMELDSLRCQVTYNGWKKDFKEAERAHTEFEHDYDFSRCIAQMKRRQAKHEGDRSHEDLQFLDSLRLSYPGWEDDVEDANQDHYMGYGLGSYGKFRLTEKQKMYEGDRSHPRLLSRLIVVRIS